MSAESSNHHMERAVETAEQLIENAKRASRESVGALRSEIEEGMKKFDSIEGVSVFESALERAEELRNAAGSVVDIIAKRKQEITQAMQERRLAVTDATHSQMEALRGQVEAGAQKVAKPAGKLDQLAQKASGLIERFAGGLADKGGPLSGIAASMLAITKAPGKMKKFILKIITNDKIPGVKFLSGLPVIGTMIEEAKEEAVLMDITDKINEAVAAEVELGKRIAFNPKFSKKDLMTWKAKGKPGPDEMQAKATQLISTLLKRPVDPKFGSEARPINLTLTAILEQSAPEGATTPETNGTPDYEIKEEADKTQIVRDGKTITISKQELAIDGKTYGIELDGESLSDIAVESEGVSNADNIRVAFTASGEDGEVRKVATIGQIARGVSTAEGNTVTMDKLQFEQIS